MSTPRPHLFLALLCVLASAAACGPGAPEAFVVVTFNSGTTEGLAHDQAPDDGYGSAQAALSDEFYGDGLAWTVAVDETTAFFAALQPDIVAFQEIFHSPECDQVPDEAKPGFVCETWQQGQVTVAQRVLGPGYQVACHPGKNDKCIAVRRAFARIEGCEADLCLDGLAGERVPDCGSGARTARATIVTTDEERITISHVHGSSGFSDEDTRCRSAQFQQAFDNLGEQNILLGDFNTDPIRLYEGDPSAQAFLQSATQRKLDFMTEVGEDAPPTYGGLLNIDHVLSDFTEGECQSQTVSEMVYFDHRPQVCTLHAL